MKTLLVDGGLAYKYYVSIKSQKKDGTLYRGFLNKILDVRDKYKPNQIIVCWDCPREDNIRKEICKSYKANRDKHGNEYSLQLRTTQMILRQTKIDQVITPRYEADDLIATLCEDLHGTKIILAADKDLFQLLDRDDVIYVRVRSYGKDDEEIGAKWLLLEKGVPVESWHGYLALVGDTSDNISGVPDIGQVKAEELLNIEPKIVHIALDPTRQTDDEVLDIYKDHGGRPLKSAQRMLEYLDDLEISFELAKLHYNIDYNITEGECDYEKAKEVLRHHHLLWALKRFF